MFEDDVYKLAALAAQLLSCHNQRPGLPAEDVDADASLYLKDAIDLLYAARDAFEREQGLQ